MSINLLFHLNTKSKLGVAKLNSKKEERSESIAKTIKHELRREILQDKQNISTNTQKAYLNNIDKFYAWCKEEKHISQAKKVEDHKGLIQDYERYLEAKGARASTIHSYLAPLCRAWKVNMKEIEKPQRIDVLKGKDTNKNKQGQRELTREGNQRVISATHIGIRRNELFKLKGRNLIEKNGSLYVEVEKGKGGKYQLQKILPQYEQEVRELFKGIKENEKVFKQEDKSSSRHIDIHSKRREVAKEAYAYYVEQIKEGKGEELTRNLIDYFKKNHKGKEGEERYDKAYKNFLKDMGYGNVDARYILRKECRAYAREKGLPLEYNRLALSCVSVWHLSHWRNDVTIKNYLNT